MPRTSNSIYACVIRFLLSQKHIRQTRTDRTLQDGEEPSKNQVSKTPYQKCKSDTSLDPTLDMGHSGLFI